MFGEDYRIIDISLPVNSKTACFPGDVPFSKHVTVSYKDSKVINLTALTMSPHVGTHADSPLHICGDLNDGWGTAGDMPLMPFLGESAVIDISPWQEAVTPKQLEEHLSSFATFPKRILIKTAREIRAEIFENDYAYLGVDLVEYVAARGAVLIGIDCPSVDHINSKTLPAHHALLKAKMSWLENLSLEAVAAGSYFLVALPLKFTELEASPVRAVLLTENSQ